MKKRLSINLSFLKKKTFYVVLTVVFSLILASDVAVAVFVPEQSRMSGGIQGGMTMPEGFGGGDGEMSPPEGFESAEDGTTQSGTSFLQVIKSHWLVIFIIFGILDAISIFMLVRISKKGKKQKLLEMKAELVEVNEVQLSQSVKEKKSPKHSYYFWITAVVGMLILAVVVNLMNLQSVAETSQTEATVYSGIAENGNISSVLPGAGTLTDQTAISLEFPEDVEIIEWYVSNGDTVEAGAKLAQVDKVSVMSAIVAVQEKLTALDEDLKEHENDEISDTITAATDGRVKVIYAKKDTGVVETMYKSGALMLISLDGMMAVSIETDAELAAGDGVKVTLSDDSTISGKVESMTDGKAIITVSDKGTDYGEEVTVKTTDGEKVGTGKLYIHSELKVTGFTGTVSAVKVFKEEEISEGDKLLVLEDTDYTGEYELLLSQRSELEEQIQKLFGLYQDQYIYAECAGVISSLDADVQESSNVIGTAVEEEGVKIQLLTADANTDNSSATDSNEEETVENGSMENESAESGEEENAGTGSDDTENGEGGSDDTENEEAVTPESDKPSTDDIDKDESETDGTGTEISYESYTGVVSAVEGNTAVVNLLSISASGNMIEECRLSLESTLAVYTYANGQYVSGKAEEIQKNDILMLIYKSEEEKTTPILCIRIVGESDSKTETPEAPETSVESSEIVVPEKNMTSGATVGTESTHSQVTEIMEEEIQENYSVTTTTWLNIIPQETMEITITVDELDILSLEEGQEAQVTLDAFPGQSFSGTVTAINLNGTNSGGSSKYSAVVSIERHENMLAGMNASVVITLNTKEGVLMIPEVALVEEGSSVYVYTSYDEKTETFGDMIEVTTGVSDGENVEILSGLEEGSEYWYSCLDVVNYSTFSFTRSGGFSIQSMFGGRGR